MHDPRIPAVQLLGDSVLLRAPAVVDVLRLVTLGVHLARSRDGIVPSPRLSVLLDVLARAATAGEPPMSDAGHADVRCGVERAVLPTSEQLGTRQVAELLGITERHVTRLAFDLGGSRGPGRAWLFDRRVIDAERARRRSEAV